VIRASRLAALPGRGGERLQERLLHEVVYIAGMRAQPRRAGPYHRRVPLDEQAERGSVAPAGQPDQVAVADIHTC